MDEDNQERLASTEDEKKVEDGAIEVTRYEGAESGDPKLAATENIMKQEAVFVSPTFVAPKRTTSKLQKAVNEKSEKKPLPEPNKKEDISSMKSDGGNEQPKITSEGSKQREDFASKVPLLPFKPPNWCTICAKSYSLEILKNGVMKGEIDLTEKPFYIFGRLEGCDVVMEHPSISRYHAAIVYKGPDESGNQDSKVEEGFYIIDLGSTHGTVVNKVELKPKVYHRLRVGYVIKFGGSTRLHILQGPQDDQDEETEMEIIKQQTATRSEEEEESHGRDENVKDDEDDGITWGMAEDAVEEEIDLEKLLASRKPLELKDPKKTLRGFFEREGLDLEYEADERGTGNSKVFVIRVRLPIEDATGEEIVAEGSSTKKKDAVVACAYEACRIIDAHGMLRNAMHESERSKRAKRLAENDFYDSDDDSFLDRTGAVESKRNKRMKKAGKTADEPVETYDSLKEALENCGNEINTIENSLENDRRAEQLTNEESDLDDYMMLVSKRLDKKTRVSLKHRLALLKKEQRRVERLIEIVKPAELPALIPPQTDSRTSESLISESLSGKKSGKQNETGDSADGAKDVKSRSSDIKSEEPVSTTVAKKSKIAIESSVAEVVSRIDPNAKRKEQIEQAGDTAIRKKQQKKKVYGPQSGPTTDSKFTDWVPPENQSGDGRTHLNEKFGY